MALPRAQVTDLILQGLNAMSRKEIIPGKRYYLDGSGVEPDSSRYWGGWADFREPLRPGTANNSEDEAKAKSKAEALVDELRECLFMQTRQRERDVFRVPKNSIVDEEYREALQRIFSEPVPRDRPTIYAAPAMSESDLDMMARLAMELPPTPIKPEPVYGLDMTEPEPLAAPAMQGRTLDL